MKINNFEDIEAWQLTVNRKPRTLEPLNLEP